MTVWHRREVSIGAATQAPSLDTSPPRVAPRASSSG